MVAGLLAQAGARCTAALAAAILLCASSTGIEAGVSSETAKQLGTTLTPMGAERAGNGDGSIPAWTGGIAASWRGSSGEARHDPFPDEKPLLAITAGNLADYAARLPEGQKALFARDPDYRLEIYPSHRTAAAPQSVYDQTRANATRAAAGPHGIAYGIAGAAGGIPFPIPSSGIEVIWNQLLAFWGTARDDHLRTYLVAADGTLSLTNAYREIIDFPYYNPALPPAAAGYYFKRREISDGPPSLAGRGYLLWQPLDSADRPVEAWQYLPRERRVRRSPILSYDTPTPDGGGIQSFDDYYMFSGSPDRYAFTLLGKREMFIPYNNNRFHQLPVAKVAGPRHANPDSLRYELHRVWVVDAVLADGKRHLVPHRRFYIDEDTWFAVYIDAWDAERRLWKFSEATMYVVPELPAVVPASQFEYDLQSGGYVLAFVFNEEAEPYRLVPPHSDSVFSPDALANDSNR